MSHQSKVKNVKDVSLIRNENIKEAMKNFKENIIKTFTQQP